ncbi:hypothetical protein JCM6882_007531 [Rhodosporidiobolus microsporus]
MARARSSTAVSAASDSDGEIVEKTTAASSPATSEQVEEKPVKAADGTSASAEPKTADEESKPPEKPAALVNAIKAMLAKTQVFLDRIEEARRQSGQAQDDDEEDDDIEVVESDSPGKRKRKGAKQQKPQKKKKAAAPPVKMPHPNLITGATLKDYQEEGVQWLCQRWVYALNGAILADEMGTGKTLQSIGLLAFLREYVHSPDKPQTNKPAIVVMPKAVLLNWKAEFKKFAPSIPVLLYDGSPQERGDLRRNVLGLKGYKNAPPNVRNPQYPVILVTYGIAMKDMSFLKTLDYECIILDEAHKTKNLKGKTLAALRLLKSDFRLLLTGTPLQNNLKELYALLFFILPQIFTDEALFEQQFDFSNITAGEGVQLSEQQEAELLIMQLQNLLKPFMLRRCKKDVVKDLPLKKEYVLTAPLTARQKELTDAAIKGELRTIFANEEAQRREAASGTATPEKRTRRSREVEALDTASVEAAGRPKRSRAARGRKSYTEAQDAADDDEFEEQVLMRAEQEEREKEAARMAQLTGKSTTSLAQKQAKFTSAMTNMRQIANHPLLKLDDRPADPDPEDIVNLSGKMMLLDRLLPALFKEGHKVIIFSQFTTMLDLLDDYFHLRGWKYYRIDGTGEFKPDPEQINDFNDNFGDDRIDIFALSTRAGGVGINLVGADTVILFDSDWNPQNDLQAMDRAHRIGQVRPVLVFRLASAGTVEQQILSAATKKRKLERIVLGNDHLAGDAADLLNKAKGRKTGAPKKEEMMQQLALQLASAEGQNVTLAGVGSEILSDEQLAALLDRSDAAMKSDTGSVGQKGKSNAAFEVVETIEEEEVQHTSTLAELLGEARGEPVDSATTSADEGEDDE